MSAPISSPLMPAFGVRWRAFQVGAQLLQNRRAHVCSAMSICHGTVPSRHGLLVVPLSSAQRSTSPSPRRAAGGDHDFDEIEDARERRAFREPVGCGTGLAYGSGLRSRQYPRRCVREAYSLRPPHVAEGKLLISLVWAAGSSLMPENRFSGDVADVAAKLGDRAGGHEARDGRSVSQYADRHHSLRSGLSPCAGRLRAPPSHDIGASRRARAVKERNRRFSASLTRDPYDMEAYTQSVSCECCKRARAARAFARVARATARLRRLQSHREVLRGASADVRLDLRPVGGGLRWNAPEPAVPVNRPRSPQIRGRRLP